LSIGTLRLLPGWPSAAGCVVAESELDGVVGTYIHKRKSEKEEQRQESETEEEEG
jgi:hypothetical protein